MITCCIAIEMELLGIYGDYGYQKIWTREKWKKKIG